MVRIPNPALSFRPPPTVLKAIGEREPVFADGKASGTREVWEYDGKQFKPIAVHAGLADDGWTELVSGDLRAGDALGRAPPSRRNIDQRFDFFFCDRLAGAAFLVHRLGAAFFVRVTFLVFERDVRDQVCACASAGPREIASIPRSKTGSGAFGAGGRCVSRGTGGLVTPSAASRRGVELAGDRPAR